MGWRGFRAKRWVRFLAERERFVSGPGRHLLQCLEVAQHTRSLVMWSYSYYMLLSVVYFESHALGKRFRARGFRLSPF